MRYDIQEEPNELKQVEPVFKVLWEELYNFNLVFFDVG